MKPFIMNEYRLIKRRKLFYIQILKIIVPLLYTKTIGHYSIEKSACQLYLLASLYLDILQNKYITNVGRLKLSRNYIRLIDKASTALFRSSTQPTPDHLFSTTPSRYLIRRYNNITIVSKQCTQQANGINGLLD